MRQGGAVLVIGATGEVGSRVLAELGTRGVPVRAASRQPAVASAASAPCASGPVDWVRFDLEAPETFDPALAGVERVFLIARPGDDDADRPARPLVQAMLRAGVRHVVDLSAMGAETRDDFALRKIELMLERSGMEWTHLRPNWFMQIFSGGPLLAAIRATGELRLPADGARLSFIDAYDIAGVAAAALAGEGHAGRAYTLTGGEALDHEEVVAAIAAASGRRVAYVPIGEDEARTLLAASGLGLARVERLIGFYRLVRAGACAPVSTAVAEVLGRPPRAFPAFAREHASVWREARPPRPGGQAEPGG